MIMDTALTLALIGSAPRFARALEMDFFPTLTPRVKTAAEKGAGA